MAFGETPEGLISGGWEALRRQDGPRARDLFERSVALRERDPNAWYGLAVASRALGDREAHVAALDRTLELAPGHLLALMMKADHYAEAGDARAAEAFYRAAIERAPPPERLTPQLRAELARAAKRCAHFAEVFQEHLQQVLAAAGFDPARSSRRFVQSLDLMQGKKEIFPQAPTSFYFPELPQRQFYEREEFAWAAALEARTAQIRDELLTLLGDEAGFEPYMKGDSARPPGDFGGLRENRDWSAYYLIKGGTASADAAVRCPATMAALRDVPLCEAEGRTPSALFSLLRPGARIPPHNGHINARLICHLPLIVPDGCALRVGNDVRPWRVGETLIFDDSIEHEAWNNSDQLRVVLLFEVWRPELTAEERTLVAALLSAVGSIDP